MNQDFKAALDAYAVGERALAHAIFDEMAEAYVKGNLNMDDEEQVSTSSYLYRGAHQLGRTQKGYAGPQVKPTPVRNPQVQDPQAGGPDRLTSVTYEGGDPGNGQNPAAPFDAMPVAQAGAIDVDDWDTEPSNSSAVPANAGIARHRQEKPAGEQVPVQKIEEVDNEVDLERSESAFGNKPKPKDDKKSKEDEGDDDTLKIVELSSAQKTVRDTGRIPVSRSATQDVPGEAETELDEDSDELDSMYYGEEKPDDDADDSDGNEDDVPDDDDDLIQEA